MLCNRYISWEFKNCSGSTSLQKGFWTIDQYRPIFLLSNLYKIFGKLMHQRLLVFLKSQKVLYKNYLGIKKKLSACLGIISLIENIHKVVGNKLFNKSQLLLSQWMYLNMKSKVVSTEYHRCLRWVPFFMIHMHDLVKFSQPFLSVDDTCFPNIQSVISKINKWLNKDLKELSFWLNPNKITLNVAKIRSYFSRLNTDLALVNWILSYVGNSFVE